MFKVKPPKINALRANDHKVQMFGTFAVVTGRLTTVAVERSKDVREDRRFTDVWILLHGICTELPLSPVRSTSLTQFVVRVPHEGTKSSQRVRHWSSGVLLMVLLRGEGRPVVSIGD